MKNIQDLQFRKEIIPLFDSVCNEYSRDILLQLLTEAPEDLEGVLTRQQILKGLMRNSPLMYPSSYSKLEFNDVYSYCQQNMDRGSGWTGRGIRTFFFLRRKRRHQERGMLAQLFMFFSKLYHCYFSQLDTSGFPSAFAAQAEQLRSWFVDFEVIKNQAIVRQRNFYVGEIAALVSLIQEKIRNGEMQAFWQNLFLFEAYLSIARGIYREKLVFPEFSDDALLFDGFYHPLIKNPVQNTLDIRKNVVLLTGPNMSGKSTLLKSIGLCVYLGHLGLGVSAEACKMPFFDVISIVINLQDDMGSGYSHFMTEIQNLKKVVGEARGNKRCFAIFDELFRGTNAEDALAISLTTVNGLTGFEGSYFFISTHLHQLQEALAEQEGDVLSTISTYHIECKLSENRPVFTYEVKDGWSSLRIGQTLFEQEGLNALLQRPAPMGGHKTAPPSGKAVL